MSKIFAAVKSALLAIDTVITRMVHQYWISTLQAQLRHEREQEH